MKDLGYSRHQKFRSRRGGGVLFGRPKSDPRGGGVLFGGGIIFVIFDVLFYNPGKFRKSCNMGIYMLYTYI